MSKFLKIKAAALVLGASVKDTVTEKTAGAKDRFNHYVEIGEEVQAKKDAERAEQAANKAVSETEARKQELIERAKTARKIARDAATELKNLTTTPLTTDVPVEEVKDSKVSQIRAKLHRAS